MTFIVEALRIDAELEAARIQSAIRKMVRRLKKRGVVIGLSGGIDSSVCAALCVRALGANRVLGLFLPEVDSSSDSYRLGKLMADHLGIDTILEDIGPVLHGAQCYRRRDQAIQTVIPDYGPGWRCKIVLRSLSDQCRYPIFSLIVQSPAGEQTKVRLSAEAYLGIVAATNFKQRARRMIEYYHADRLNYAVIGTPNRVEYDQGFFVKNGDGAADLKPIAHLYKSQVYQLACHLGVPNEIQKRTPTTDTYSLEQSQDEFYFGLPLDQFDLCLFGKNHGVSIAEVAGALDLPLETIASVYEDISAKRIATRYLHTEPLLVQDIPEITTKDHVHTVIEPVPADNTKQRLPLAFLPDLPQPVAETAVNPEHVPDAISEPVPA